MIFSKPWFLLLFVSTAITFFCVPVRWRHAVLIGSGLMFYVAVAGPWWLALVLGLILLTYWASGTLGVWLNATVLIGLLAYFKLHGGLTVFSSDAKTAVFPTHLLFPLGFSFLSFELIHVAVERHRSKLPHLTLPGLAAFALYFPCRLAGPIKRYPAFEASVQAAQWSITRCYTGLVRILWGFIKKVAAADVLHLMVDELNVPTTPLQTWKGLLAYSLYLFLDFSAYSDIAIGMSWILGLEVPENFRSPYLARNIREFWSRWHMSLSSWLADYLYLPLSRRFCRRPLQLPPRLAAVFGYLITFTLCGLWHGPALHLLLWGLYHGMLLSAYAVYAAGRRAGREGKGWSPLTERLGRVGCQSATFVLVTAGWLFFAFEVSKALEIGRRLLGGRG